MPMSTYPFCETFHSNWMPFLVFMPKWFKQEAYRSMSQFGIEGWVRDCIPHLTRWRVPSFAFRQIVSRTRLLIPSRILYSKYILALFPLAMKIKVTIIPIVSQMSPINWVWVEELTQ